MLNAKCYQFSGISQSDGRGRDEQAVLSGGSEFGNPLIQKAWTKLFLKNTYCVEGPLIYLHHGTIPKLTIVSQKTTRKLQWCLTGEVFVPLELASAMRMRRQVWAGQVQ